MKVSYKWLKELLPDLSLSPAEVAQQLSLHSFEATVAAKMEVDPAVVVVKITAIEPHPNADRLRVVTIETGSEEVKVVCGAKNFDVGDMVPYSPPGAFVMDENGQPFEVKTATIRGVESPGMLNSPRELGLGTSHAGLYILPSDVSLGSKLSEYITSDTIIEADITPNRAHDTTSHLGLARELGALQKVTIKEPVATSLSDISILSDWQVKADSAQTIRYVGLLLDNIKISPSPLWLQAKLWAIGIRPINNVVDITNYVSWETGNPIHAFDADTLSSTTMQIRCAEEGEKLTTLDGKINTMNSEVLVVANGNAPVAIAGIMGGSATEVGNTTQRIFVEVATFDATTIRRSSARLQLRTDSSTRFGRGLPPVLVDQTAARALYLLQKLIGATIQGKIEYYPAPQKPRTIQFDPARVTKIAGVPITDEQCRVALTQLRCVISPLNNVWNVEIPLDRLDLEGTHDLVEEVVRFVGLDHIPAQEPGNLSAVDLPSMVRLREFFRDEFAAAGFTETYSYSFEDEPFAKKLNLLDASALTISNPMAPELAQLRTSLIPGLLRVIKRNRSEIQRPFKHTEKAFFEVGHIYRAGEKGKVAGIAENEYIAAVILTAFNPQAFISSLLEKIGASADAVTTAKGVIKYGDTVVGRIVEYGPADLPIARALKTTITAFEIDLDIVLTLQHLPNESWRPRTVANENIQYKAPSPYPSVYRDISMLVDVDVTVEEAQELIERVGGDLVVDSELFDQFTPPDNKLTGLAFHVEYQARDKTLNAEEIEEAHNRIIKALEAELGAQIR